MNKRIYLGMSVLDISKTLMYEFWYDYLKPKYGDKPKLCYTDTGGFIIHVITEDVFEDISNDLNHGMIFLMMLNHGMIHLIMMKMIRDHFQ